MIMSIPMHGLFSCFSPSGRSRARVFADDNCTPLQTFHADLGKSLQKLIHSQATGADSCGSTTLKSSGVLQRSWLSCAVDCLISIQSSLEQATKCLNAAELEELLSSTAWQQHMGNTVKVMDVCSLLQDLLSLLQEKVSWQLDTLQLLQHSKLCNGDIIRASSALNDRHPVNSHPKNLEAFACEKILSCARIISSWIGATSVIHLIDVFHGTSNSTDVNKITVNSQLSVQAVLTCDFVTFLILKIITGILSPTEAEQTNANMKSSLRHLTSRAKDLARDARKYAQETQWYCPLLVLQAQINTELLATGSWHVFDRSSGKPTPDQTTLMVEQSAAFASQVETYLTDGMEKDGDYRRLLSVGISHVLRIEQSMHQIKILQLQMRENPMKCRLTLAIMRDDIRHLTATAIMVLQKLQSRTRTIRNQLCKIFLGSNLWKFDERELQVDFDNLDSNNYIDELAVGRPPTRTEESYGYRHGLTALLQDLEGRDAIVSWENILD
ncbi:hypothetical protein KP509_30G062400 [Ceratopteris richardii]|uniref:Uncharacterized protein n=1 Tax=Ceratopteris richardii TaxID=49495 RepID=A0A8T2R370_CERRI|nr:hypothetical protein KP509_30G062400 [Ceratopteris richardii]KAH7290758.1 hypothetical protein KP509_30G062400 [Ceratopteris richardii]